MYFFPFIGVTVRVDGVHKGESEPQIGLKQAQRKEAVFVMEEKWAQTSGDFGTAWLIWLWSNKMSSYSMEIGTRVRSQVQRKWNLIERLRNYAEINSNLFKPVLYRDIVLSLAHGV